MTVFRRRVSPWLAALAAVLLTALLSAVLGFDYLRAQADIRSALSARAAMTETLSIMKDGETGVRGFLLTDDPRFLAPYEAALPKLRFMLATLERVGASDTSQRQSALLANGLARRKLELLATLIQRRNSRIGSEADELALLREGKLTMDSLRVEIDRMLDRADSELAVAEAAAESAKLRFQLLVVGALLGALAFSAFGLRKAQRDALDVRLISAQLGRDLAARQQAEASLRDQTRLLESVLSSIGDGVVVLNADRSFEVINPAAKHFVPWQVGDRASPSEWVKECPTFLPDGRTPFPPEIGPLTLALQGRGSDGVELVIVDPQRVARSFSVTTRPITVDGVTRAAVAVFRDTSALRSAQNALLESEERYRVLSEATFEGVAVTIDGLIVDTNPRVADWLGYTRQEMVGMSAPSFFVPEDRALVARQAHVAESSYEATMMRRDGSTFPVEMRGRLVTFRNQVVRLAAIRDVTEKKQREAELLAAAERLRTIALHDELTGLYNRRGFLEVAERLLIAARAAGRALTVLFADLNGMKLINDELGHEMGDHALRATAKLLREQLGPTAVLARLGGDEFAIACDLLDEVTAVNALASLEAAVKAHNAQSGSRYRLSISAGLAVASAFDSPTLFDLMQAADANMYETKRARNLRPSLRVLPPPEGEELRIGPVSGRKPLHD